MRKVLLLLAIVLFFITACKKDKTETPVTVNQNIINAIGVDGQGNKWFATPAGLYRFNNSNWLNFQLPTTSQEVHSIKIQNDTLLLSLASGALMVKISGDVLSTLDQYSKSQTALISDTVNVAAFDSYNNIWFGTFLGISLWKDDQMKSNSKINSNIFTFNQNISCIAFRQNDYFFGTFGDDLWHIYHKNDIDAISGASKMINTFNGDLTSDSIFSLFAAKDSSIWIGTNLGLTRNKGITHVGGGAVFEYFLQGQRIRSILESSDGHIWAGTETGLYAKNGAAWTKYTTSEGLVNNIVLSLGEDIDGGIWIGTQNGISLFKNAAFTNFMLQ